MQTIPTGVPTSVDDLQTHRLHECSAGTNCVTTQSDALGCCTAALRNVLSVTKEDRLVGQGSILQRDNDPEQEEKKEMLAAHDGGAVQSPDFNLINSVMNEESEKQSKLQREL